VTRGHFVQINILFLSVGIVAWSEVGGHRGERDKAAVAADGRVAPRADDSGETLAPIAQPHIAARFVREHRPVAADGGVVAVGRRCAGGSQALECDLAAGAIEHVDVAQVVGVSRCESRV
jgi:hypothetical protein